MAYPPNKDYSELIFHNYNSMIKKTQIHIGHVAFKILYHRATRG